MRRTTFLATTALAGTRLLAPAAARAADAFADIETRYGGRLGVFVRDLGSGATLTHRADERFAMCSTFKLLLTAAVLARVAAGRARLEERVRYTRADLLGYAPIAEAHLGTGGVGSMTLGALCAAAVEWSDNTAANLLLARIGGPRGYTAFARSIGDPSTRLDRNEPALNSAIPGDPRDTTTPRAMAADIERLVFGPALPPPLRTDLRDWMLACRTADARIPAGLPTTWRSGNKTGTGERNTANDIAFILRPHRAPLVAAVYFTEGRRHDERDAAVAATARIIARRFA